MNPPLPSPPNSETLSAPRNLDVYGAAAFRDTLLALGTCPALVVDLAAVESCDVAGLQLLWAAKRSADASGRTFALKNPSPAVLQTCTGLGLDLTQL